MILSTVQTTRKWTLEIDEDDVDGLYEICVLARQQMRVLPEADSLGSYQAREWLDKAEELKVQKGRP